MSGQNNFCPKVDRLIVCTFGFDLLNSHEGRNRSSQGGLLGQSGSLGQSASLRSTGHQYHLAVAGGSVPSENAPLTHPLSRGGTDLRRGLTIALSAAERLDGSLRLRGRPRTGKNSPAESL